MKAMILAAGLGTRLRPFTRHTPKPLFTIGQQPLLGIIIERLCQAGCKAVMINTHHLHEQIEAYVSHHAFPIQVETRYEPEILGTGGGIANVADFWDSGPLMVINADIVSDIDLARTFGDHQGHDFPVTMVMHHHSDFNTVSVDTDHFVVAFGPSQEQKTWRKMAFTGIHVLDRRVLDFLPSKGPAHIIDAYEQMLACGEKIKAHVVRDHYWQDIGTPQNYSAAVYDHMAPMAFKHAFGSRPAFPITRHRMHGDGSDRHWYRLEADGQTLIMVDHDIRPHPGWQEVDAYVAIGRHLHAIGVAVPHIFLHDNCAGLVFMEDLGEQHLQALIPQQTKSEKRRFYEQVIDQWIHLAIEGAKEFDPAWTHQSTHYDRDLILEKECRYFMEAFLHGYLGWNIAYEDMAVEFEHLVDGVRQFGINGLMHRDLQSRNIMIKAGRIHFIDFQGSRMGPLQYDLASLLIDPYVALPVGLQDQLRAYCTAKLQLRHGLDPDRFQQGYRYCALTRNLQILGAFAFLSRVKGKIEFKKYIPQAVKSLQHNLSCLQTESLPKLVDIADRMAALFN